MSKKAEGFSLRFVLINTGNISRKVLSKVLRSFDKNFERLHLHAGRLLLIEVENAYDGEIREKDGVFQSSKRKGNGVGIQSIQHIAEKSGGASTFAYQNGAFCAKVMLCG